MDRTCLDARRGYLVFLLGLFVLTLSFHFVYDTACFNSSRVFQCNSSVDNPLLGKREAANSVFHTGYLLPTTLTIALTCSVFSLVWANVPLVKGRVPTPLTPPPLSF